MVTTSDKEGENSKFDQELVDAEVIITTPYAIDPYIHHFPAILTTILVSIQVISQPSVLPKPRSSRLPLQLVSVPTTLISTLPTRPMEASQSLK